jgi:tetratricopeptide (TPR) repeat protein
MTISTLQGEEVFPFDSIFFHDQIDRVIEQALPNFYRLIKWHVVFHLSFLFTGLLEVFLVLFFLTDLVKSSLLAVSLAGLFFTFFSYFIIRLYLNNKKPEQFKKIVSDFTAICQDLVNFQDEVPEHRFALATAYTKYATAMHGKDEKIWRLPAWLELLRPSMERFSFWWHWHDLHSMRERLLLKAVDEHLEIVKMEPTDLEVHAALANAYVTLSGVYVNPYSEHDIDAKRIPHEGYRQKLKDRFRFTAERAIEEFKILNDYAPDDPWVHVQLAYSYRDLGMPKEEINEYEIVLSLCPDDYDTLYRLGMLYFEQGHNAKGLDVYEALRTINFKKAEQLIAHYSDRHRIFIRDPEEMSLQVS